MTEVANPRCCLPPTAWRTPKEGTGGGRSGEEARARSGNAEPRTSASLRKAAPRRPQRGTLCKRILSLSLAPLSEPQKPRRH